MQDVYTAAVARGELICDPAQEAVLPVLEALRQALETETRGAGLRGFFAKPRPKPGGVYLWGGVGRGKSMLMDMFVSTVTAPKRRVHFHAFMQEIHAGMHQVRKTGADDALKPVVDRIIARVRLLAFDEMQVTDITDAMIVGRVFEMLLGAGVVVVVTSNRAPDDLYKDGLNRGLFLPFIEFLNTRLVVHELESPEDYRRHQLAGRQVFFHPSDGHARAELDRIWQELSGGQSDRLSLTVQGRTVVLPRYHAGFARLSFWDLCGKPLGAADYLAVADVIKVLILEDVPRLGRANYNEAKRFVILIDVLYEAKTRLIMSAADMPERLYLEGSGAFEFERTISRLQEMQSDAWGA